VGLIPESARADLLPGETPVGYWLVSQLAGGWVDEPDEAPRAGLSLDLHPLGLVLGGGGIDISPNWLAAKLGGVNGAGRPGSLGYALGAALQKGSHLLVTDSRLCVVGDTAGLLKAPHERVVFAVPHAAVVGCERAPRLLQRGRVRLTLGDGTWAMAMMGMFSARTARRLQSLLGR
jgi:hypothetical protein